MRMRSGVHEGGSPLTTTAGGRQLSILWMRSSVVGAVVDCAMRSGEETKQRTAATSLAMDMEILSKLIRRGLRESSSALQKIRAGLKPSSLVVQPAHDVR